MDFKTLIDLVNTVNKNKVKNIEVLGNPDQEASMIEAFYAAIARGRLRNDEEAVKFLYGKNEGVKSKTYLRTKHRLIRQLINTSLFVDINQPMFNERAKAYYNCYRDFAAAFMLALRGALLAATVIFEQTIEQTIKYEMVDLTADIARELRRLYARSANDQVKHERISTIHRQYEEKRRLEMLALDYYENLINYYIVRRSPNEEVNKYAASYFEELLPLAPQADTSQFYFYTYQIGIIKFFSENNCAAALKTCEESLDILRSRKNTNRGALAAVVLQKMLCLTQLRIFNEECDEAVQYSLSLLEEGDANWFRTHEVHLHYCLFARRYTDALDIFSKASKHERFSTLAGTARDNWQLYGGYLHLLAVLGKLDKGKVTESVGEFAYTALSNDIELVDRDKQGMNIPLVMLPIIYSLVTRTFHDTEEVSTDALEKYRKRHLENDLNRRSAAFLNLMFAFAKKDYQSASAEKKIKKELEVLSKEQPQIAGQTFAVEIIPYEDLWEMMVENG
ncbi:MAG: hypothetical protein ACKVUS_01260 [Saprospiraceae bacterium]